MKYPLWRILHTAVLILFFLLIKVSGYSRKRHGLRPSFMPTRTNVTVNMGELATLECKIRNLGPKQVSWRKVSKDYPLTVGELTFDPKEDIAVDHKKNGKMSQWNLVIKQANVNHTGKYECQISATEIYTHHVHLRVLETPKEYKPAISVTGTKFVNLFDPIKLKCNATGAVRAPEDIDWFHNGNMIVTENKKWRGRILITEFKPEVPGRSLISELKVFQSYPQDDGRYVCRSSDLETVLIDVNVLNTSRKPIKRDDNDGNPPRNDRNIEADSGSGVTMSNLATTTAVVTFTTLWVILAR